MNEEQVTIYRNFNIVDGQSTIKLIVDAIRRGDFAFAIRELRRLLASGDIKAYNNAKKALLAFTPSGMFVGGRKMQYLVQYSYVIVLDLDKLTVEMMIRVKGIICGIPCTLACFISPSGNGLKVLVRVSTGPEEHLKTFLAVQRYYVSVTGVEIDPSGKDITRLCFVSDDPEAYYNQNAVVFGEEFVDVGAGIVEEGPSLHREQDMKKIFKRCVKFVNKYSQFVDGQRNNYVFKLALQLRKEGVEEESALTLIQKDYNFDDKEVRNTVRSAFQTNVTSTSLSDHAFGTPSQDAEQPDVENDLQPKKRNKKKHKTLFVKKCNFPTQAELEKLYNMALVMHLVIPDPDAEKSLENKKMHYVQHEVEVLIESVFNLRYNKVQGVVEWKLKNSDYKFQKLGDYETNSICRWLHFHKQFIPMGTLINLLNSNFSPDYDVYQDYFRALRWDGKTDYIGRLCNTVTTADPVYWEFCFRKWFVAYAMSLYIDEIINHTIIVFVGKQGVGKSSWMKNLVPDALKEYLGTGALLTDNKDTPIMIGESALIILDEWESYSHRELAAFKELVTRPEIRIRRPYGRSSVGLPHRASFIASVNEKHILTDKTGTRRYLCSTVIKVEFDKDMNIDGCMAQAIALGKKGFRYWFDQDEIHDLNEHNEVYMAKTTEEEHIETWLRTVTLEEWNTRDQFPSGRNIKLMKAADVAQFLISKGKIKMESYTNTSIGRIMTKLNFLECTKRKGKYYIVRILTDDVVERGLRTMDETDADSATPESPNKFNSPDQFTQSQEGDDELPF
jgi:hypothetical protein